MLSNVSLTVVVVFVVLAVLSFGLNVFTLVRLATMGAELRVLRQVLAGELAPKPAPFDWDKVLGLGMQALALYQRIESEQAEARAQAIRNRPAAAAAAGVTTT